MGNIEQVRKITIVDLINKTSTSIRLKNSINSANRTNQLPFETIGDYLDAGITAKDKLMKIKNFGRKTADELVSIIEAVCTKGLPENPDDLGQIRNTSIVDLVNKYEMSNRLKNRIIITKGEKKLPFPFATIGDYLDAGVTAEDTLLRLKNLGRKTAEEFISLIETLTKELPKPSEPEKNVDAEIKHNTGDEIQIRNTSILDLVNKYAISARLKNCINVANEKNQLPFETVGDYLNAGGTARCRLLEIGDLGRKTVGELIHLIETVRGTALSDETENKKRFDLVEIISEQYPGVFDPLIEKYSSIPKEDKLGLEKLEAVLLDLCDKKSNHAEMVWLRFSGETLAEVGRGYGITRERVRQLTARYTDYIIDTSSKSWAEKSVRHLIKKNNNGNILPDKSQLERYHPKLIQALIASFSTKEKGKLKPERRLEIAKALQLDIDHELAALNTWPLEKVLFEVRLFAKDLGHPDLMPMQKEMIEYARQDLRGAVGRHGGQSRIAHLAGLTYQGQMVSPDGSRTYWTDERIKDFLHDVARKEGHPGIMPTPSEAAKHAPNPKTMFSIFTRLAFVKKANISWFELAQLHGLQYKKGLTRVTQGFIKSFVKSLGGALYHLSPAEIYVLFEQQGMTKTGVNRHRDRISDNLVEAIQSGNLPKGEIERWLDDEKGELIDALLNPEIKTVEEAFQYAGRDLKKKRKNKRDNPEDDTYREDVETRLPVPSAGDTLDSLKTSTDLLTQASSDKEAVEFLIAKAADKLWKRCFYDENAAVKEANNHKGNAYSESARDAFIEEYTHCSRLPIPKGYAFVDPGGRKRQPKLMQRLIAYRVFTKGRVLNLSGTGTGKTLSAILASRVIGAKLTIITCPNVTVEAWHDNILNAFPWSEVIIKPKNWEPVWKKSQRPRYIVVNHETFQNRNESALKRFIIRNPYDLVVIDEIHQAKQRDPESESQRRRLLNGLITDIPKGRAKPRVLGLSATPIINNLQEGKSLVELVTSLAHDDIGTKANVPNCMRLYQRFTTIGFRMMPKSDVSREPQIHPVDATPLLGELVALGTRPHPQQVEAVLVKARWPIIKNCLRKKTVIFTEYVKDIVPVLSEWVKSSGFSVGIYTGDEKLATSADYHNALHQFIKGDTDVLIASIRTIATGVDGLQYACNNVIFASLPWTSANYDQAVGRFDREGFAFDRLDIHIPKTYAILSTGEEWSWCDSRLRRLENKRDIAKAAVDGEIPDTENQLTSAKATQYWMGWLKRLNDECFYEIERREIKVPLDESDETDSARRYKTYGDFSKLNALWNNTHSSKTQKRLAEHPEEWCFYHTRLLEQEKIWQIVRRDQCVKHLQENLPRGSVVADFGCGQGKLAEALKDFHIVHSFDHLAIHPGIVSGDMSHTPLDDGSIDAAVFSLSLMGTNIGDYISEAYRVLKLGGQLIIWHPARHNDRSQFVEGLKKNGFAIVKDGQVYKWHRIWAIKQARRTDDVTKIVF